MKATEEDNPAINTLTGETFSIRNAKLYFPPVSLSTKNNNKLMQQLKSGFERTIMKNKYRW